MAKDQSSKSLSRNSYLEKISKVTFGFPRRKSHNPKDSYIPNPSYVTIDPPTRFVTHTTPVSSYRPVSGEVNPTPKDEPFVPPEVKPRKKFVRFSSVNVKKNGDGGVNRNELAGQKTFSEEKYNSYIDSAKMKMRAPSNVSNERTLSRRETINDMFSSYISRTKLRLRTTSSVDNS